MTESDAELSSINERYDTKIVPEQQKILNNLTVDASIEDRIGVSLATAIDEAFANPPEFSSNETQIAAIKMAQDTDLYLRQISEVREVEVSDENTRSKFLVKKTILGEGLKATEIFKVPENKLLKSGVTVFLEYQNFLLTDREGKTCDLLDLSEGNTSTYNSNIKSTKIPFYDPLTRRIVLGQQSSKDKVLSMAHESGHSYQNTRGRIAQTIHTFISILKEKNIIRGNEMVITETSRRERNAWAFALAAMRRYKQLGMDLGISNKMAMGEANTALEAYGAYHGNDPQIKFRKKSR